MSKTRTLNSSSRMTKNIPLVSVFGYTNAGKTSLVKCLTNDEKLQPENKLFATLDVTYHGYANNLANSSNILFIDTVKIFFIFLTSDVHETPIELFMI